MLPLGAYPDLRCSICNNKVELECQDLFCMQQDAVDKWKVKVDSEGKVRKAIVINMVNRN
eukprot:8021445-Pyramimonas_sp.AAC.1